MGTSIVEATYPEVAPFVQSMYAELFANRGKGDQAGWRKMSLREAWYEISWHSAKLAVAIKEKDESLIRELSADVANGCMMLVDILNTNGVAPSTQPDPPLFHTPWGAVELTADEVGWLRQQVTNNTSAEPKLIRDLHAFMERYGYNSNQKAADFIHTYLSAVMPEKRTKS